MFKQSLVTPLVLTSEDTDHGRFYTTPSGVKYPSVTTVLDVNSDPEILEQWRKRIGHREAESITRRAGTKGTKLHNSLEKYVRGESLLQIKKGMMPIDLLLFNSIKEKLDHNLNEVYGIELALFSDKMKIAGRTDLFGVYKGVNSIVDYKNSRGDKKEEWIENYFLQTTCYAIMAEKLYEIDIPQVAILIASPEGTQEFVKEKDQYVDKLRKVIGKYYETH